jgi:hypothetical protein
MVKANFIFFEIHAVIFQCFSTDDLKNKILLASLKSSRFSSEKMRDESILLYWYLMAYQQLFPETWYTQMLLKFDP